MILRLQNISLPLADFALEVSLDITSRVTGLFGPSGAGKTSLLDLIAGLRNPTSALIELDAVTLINTRSGINLPSRVRRISYVPQDLALFPHLNVRANILYGHKPDATQEPAFRFDHVARVFEIEALLDRNIAMLSGGEKQRVALARAILSSPKLLLLDEPLSNLDARLKDQIMPFLQRIKQEFAIPMLYVTHQAEEATLLCDEVLSLERGRIVQRGTPSTVFGPTRSNAP